MSDRFEDVLLSGGRLGGLLPDSGEVVASVVVEVGAFGDGGEVVDRELVGSVASLLEDLGVVAADELEAEELDEVGLSGGEVEDFVVEIGGVVEGEVVGGVGKELAGGSSIEEAQTDWDDAGEEGAEVVFGHFFEGVESGEGKGNFGTHLDESAQVAEKVGTEFFGCDQVFEFFKFVEGDDQSFGVRGLDEGLQVAAEGGIGEIDQIGV